MVGNLYKLVLPPYVPYVVHANNGAVIYKYVKNMSLAHSRSLCSR